MDYAIHEHDDDIVVIDCPPRLDLNHSEQLKKIFFSTIESKKYNVVINLLPTHYVDSSGLGAIVSRIAEVRANQGDIRLVVISTLINQLLKITNLDKILKCYEDVETAVASYRET